MMENEKNTQKEEDLINNENDTSNEKQNVEVLVTGFVVFGEV